VALGHAGDVKAVAFSPDSKWIVTGSSDGTARLWEAETAQEVRTFQGHNSGVYAAAFSPDGKQVLTGSMDRTIRLWDALTGREVHRFQGHAGTVRAVAFAQDGKRVLSGAEDSTARIWDLQAGKEVAAFRVRGKWVCGVAFALDGRQVLAGDDKLVRLWDVESGKELRFFEGHTGLVLSVAFSPDGKRALTGSSDRTARLWDVETGKEVRSFQGHTLPVISVALSPNGRWALTGSGDRAVRLWDVETGKEVRSFQGHPLIVWSVAFSPDGRCVLSGSQDRTARLWDAQSGKELRRFQGHTSGVASLAFSADGRRLLTGVGSATRLWDAETGKELRWFRGSESSVKCVTFSPDGHRMLAGAGRTAVLWDVATGQQLHTCREPDSSIQSLAFSPDGKQVLTGSDKGMVRLWDAETGKEVLAFEATVVSVTSAAFSPDGRHLVTGGNDFTARLWDARSGKGVRTFDAGQDNAIWSVAFSPDGRQVAAAGMYGKVWLWDAGTGKELCSCRGHADTLANVWSVTFSPDGTRLLTGSEDRTAHLWDANTGKELRRFRGHAGSVTSTAFSPDGRRVLTGSRDRTTRLWDTETGQELCSLISFDDGSWAVIDPEGRFDAAGGGDVEGLHWVVRNEVIALKQLKERYYDPGLLAKYLGLNREPFRRVETFRNVELFPEVAFTGPAAGRKTLTLELGNRGGGIGKVQVFVNGKELIADARGPKPDPGARQTTLKVDLVGAPVLPGRPNRIEVVAWNAEGYLSSRNMVREWVPEGEAESAKPELYIIAVGITQYADPALNLRFPAKDAEDMAGPLSRGGKRLFGVEQVHLTLLTDTGHPQTQLPSKENIRGAFEAVRKARPGDILVVYLAGHGVSLRRGSDLYCYLTREARTTDSTAFADPAVLGACAVTSDELVEWIKQVPALHQVMILDTCAAGAAAAKLTEKRDVSGDQIRALDRLKDRTGFHVLMGCSADRVSYEASRYAQGLLTYSLLQGLKGAALNEGEYVDVSRLFNHAADQVPQLARDLGGIQKPLIVAPRGTSFDIGRLTAEDKAAIPLAQVKPLLLRPLLFNPEEGDDNLNLRSLLGRRLAEESYASSRGSAERRTSLFVDADEMPGGIRPSGTYLVVGMKVTVKLNLRRDGKTVASVGVVEGARDDLPGLVGKTAQAIEEAVKTVK
jgi:WD40 repeat protein